MSYFLEATDALGQERSFRKTTRRGDSIKGENQTVAITFLSTLWDHKNKEIKKKGAIFFKAILMKLAAGSLSFAVRVRAGEPINILSGYGTPGSSAHGYEISHTLG